LQISPTGDIYKKSGSRGNDTDVSSVIETIEKRKTFLDSLFDLF
jgi:hypothetical protein